MKYSLIIIFTALFAAALPVTPVLAENHDSRYSITKSDKGFLRLDKKSGNVSLCTVSAAGLTCRMGADERHAYQQEMDAINTKLAALQMRMSAVEASARSAASRSSGKNTQTRQEEFDQALKFADKAFRHFFDLMRDVKKTPKKDAI